MNQPIDDQSVVDPSVEAILEPVEDQEQGSLYLVLGSHAIIVQSKTALAPERWEKLRSDSLGKLEYNVYKPDAAYVRSRPFSSLDGDQVHYLEEVGSELEIPISTGLTVMIAPTGWGKTYFLERYVMDRLPQASLLSFGEPRSIFVDASWRENNGDVIFAANPADMLVRLAEFILLRDDMDSDVLVIDGLRPFVYGSGLGGTGAGGVDQLLYVQLSALSNVLAASAAAVIASFNPMLPELERTEEYQARFRTVVSSVEASAHGVWWGNREGNRVLNYSSRGLATEERRARQFHIPDLSADVRPTPVHSLLDLDIPLHPTTRGSLESRREAETYTTRHKE